MRAFPIALGKRFGSGNPGIPQAMEITPFRPFSIGQKKMTPTVFSSGQDAELEEIAMGRRLQIYDLPSGIVFDDGYAGNFSEKLLKAEVRRKGTVCHPVS